MGFGYTDSQKNPILTKGPYLKESWCPYSNTCLVQSNHILHPTTPWATGMLNILTILLKIWIGRTPEIQAIITLTNPDVDLWIKCHHPENYWLCPVLPDVWVPHTTSSWCVPVFADSNVTGFSTYLNTLLTNLSDAVNIPTKCVWATEATCKGVQ